VFLRRAVSPAPGQVGMHVVQSPASGLASALPAPAAAGILQAIAAVKQKAANWRGARPPPAACREQDVPMTGQISDEAGAPVHGPERR
jgi:hypothetical protein